MKTSSAITRPRRRGAATVEFALISIAFFLLLIGIIEMGRALFIFNSAAEVTRRGARTAAVKPLDSADILLDMKRIMPDLKPEQVRIAYLPSGCTVENCKYVQVSLNGYVMTPLFWDILPITVQSFQTTLPVESLGAD